MKILVVANQKGGVGKTTLTVHLGHYAHEAGLRVLLVDPDRQGSLSLTIPPAGGNGIVASQLFQPKLPKNAAVEMVEDRLGIIRADAGLLAFDGADDSVLKRVRANLLHFADQFDVCIMDSPPLLGTRLLASIAAADYVVTPLSIGAYELAGLGDFMGTLQTLRQKGINHHAKHIGFVPTNTNSRSKAESEGLAMLRQSYGDAVLVDATLPSRAAVKQAIAAQKPVWQGARGESHRLAGAEWRKACEVIFSRMN